MGGCGGVYVGWGRGGRLASLCPGRLDLGGLGWFYMWFGTNMAGRRNKNAFVLQVYIDTIWVFRMVWGWFGMFWVVWGVDRREYPKFADRNDCCWTLPFDQQVWRRPAIKRKRTQK